MSPEVLETDQTSMEVNFSNFSILQGITRTVYHLDSRMRESLQAMLGNLRLAPFVAKADEAIEVYPDSHRSREVPLSVEVFDEQHESWLSLHTDSDEYENRVELRRGFDPYFLAKSLEQDSLDGKLYAYAEDHNTRVLIKHDTQFHLAPHSTV